MQSDEIFPFRHIEERFRWFQLASFALAIYVISATLYTIRDGYLVSYCLSVAIALGFVTWRRNYLKYAHVLPRIIQGKKRIFELSLTLAFGTAMVASAALLAINLNTRSGLPRQVQAEVIKITPPSFRSGWTADLKFEGDTHFLNIRPEHAQTLRCSKTVMLELTTGGLGFDYITNVNYRHFFG